MHQIPLIVLSLAFTAPAFAQESPKPFRLKDGYVQIVSYSDSDPKDVSPHEPVQLVDGVDVRYPESAERGSSWNFWITLQVVQDVPSPCSKREEKACRFEMDLVPKQTDYSGLKLPGYEPFRLDAGESITVNYGEKIPRTTEPGEYVLLFRVTKDGLTHFQYTFPLNVR